MCEEFEKLLIEVEVLAWNAPESKPAPHNNIYPICSSDAGGNPVPDQLSFRKPDKFCNHLGLPPCLFPKPEELDKHDLYRLTDAMERLYIAWHIIPSFPPGITTWRKYMLLKGYLESEVVILHDGYMHILFETEAETS